jgi:hypothetical protein
VVRPGECWQCAGADSERWSPLVSEFTVSTTSHPTSAVSAAPAAGDAFDFCGRVNARLRLENFPQEIVGRISVTNRSNTRPTLQATSTFLFHILRSTPDAWDTFEVMTGTPDCLTTPLQVEQHLQRSGVRPLSVALTVAGPQQDKNKKSEPENVHAIIESVVGAASRIGELILDVH